MFTVILVILTYIFVRKSHKQYMAWKNDKTRVGYDEDD